MMENYTLYPQQSATCGMNRIYLHNQFPVSIVDGIRGYVWKAGELEKLQQELGTKLLLTVQELTDSVAVNCLAKTDQTRALEFLDYMLGQYGIVKGNAFLAQGNISSVLLKVAMSDLELSDSLEFFMKMAESYFREVQIIRADSYCVQNKEAVRQMKRYHKKPVSWAFVRTTDIASEGTQICIKTLENDTGVMVTASSESVIMIGCMGEVYEITMEKFLSSYETSTEPLDIFTQMLDFIPAVEIPAQNLYLTIDEKAHLCYPRPGSGIRAAVLLKRTKVYIAGSNEYFIGKPGDYLAIRMDDDTDLYIIQQEVFRRTYERD